MWSRRRNVRLGIRSWKFSNRHLVPIEAQIIAFMDYRYDLRVLLRLQKDFKGALIERLYLSPYTWNEYHDRQQQTQFNAAAQIIWNLIWSCIGRFVTNSLIEPTGRRDVFLSKSFRKAFGRISLNDRVLGIVVRPTDSYKVIEVAFSWMKNQYWFTNEWLKWFNRLKQTDIVFPPSEDAEIIIASLYVPRIPHSIKRCAYIIVVVVYCPLPSFYNPEQKVCRLDGDIVAVSIENDIICVVILVIGSEMFDTEFTMMRSDKRLSIIRLVIRWSLFFFWVSVRNLASVVVPACDSRAE